MIKLFDDSVIFIFDIVMLIFFCLHSFAIFRFVDSFCLFVYVVCILGMSFVVASFFRLRVVFAFILPMRYIDTVEQFYSACFLNN